MSIVCENLFLNLLCLFQDLGSSDVCDPLCSVDEMSSLDFAENYKPKTDLLKALAVSVSVLAGAAVINHSWVAENEVLRFFFHHL